MVSACAPVNHGCVYGFARLDTHVGAGLSTSEWASLPMAGGLCNDHDRPMTTNARTPTRRPLPSAVVRGSLRDGLLVCLGLLATDPERFEQAAVVWHRRWCAEQPGLGFADSRAALSALEALTGPDPEAAAAALRAVCPQTDGVEEVLEAWLDRPGA